MWTVENRARYDRSKLRYPSDLTDQEWSLAKREIPRAKRGGNKRTVDVREVMNGLMYVLSTGCQWRAIRKDLPPRSTVNYYFCRWQQDGRSTDCTMRFTCCVGRKPTATLVQQRPSSTARASRAQKKGAPDRSAGL